MRTALLTLAALALVATVGAAFAARSPRDPRQAPKRADRATARRIVLRPSDLPTFKSVAATGTNKLRCPSSGFDPDYSDLVLTGQAVSPSFLTSGGASIASTADLYASSRQARSAFSRSLGHGFARCLASQLNARRKKGVTIRLASVSRLHMPRLGARTLALNLNAQIVSHSTLPVVITFVSFQKGRALVEMTALAARQPFFPGLTRSLAQRLARRAPG
jgi:hypothetical protein